MEDMGSAHNFRVEMAKHKCSEEEARKLAKEHVFDRTVIFGLGTTGMFIGDLIRQKYPEAKIVFVARSEKDSPKISFALEQAKADYVQSKYDTNEESADFENKVVISLRDLTKETIKLFEANDASTDELSDYQMKQIETYYKTIVTDFESSYWYQLNVMKGIKADIEAGLLQFATEDQKASALDAAEYYIDAYYSSLTYVSNGFDWAMELMEIVVDGYASNYSEYTEEVANLKAIVALAKAELAELEISAEGTISGDYSRAEKAEFAELYKEFLEAAEAFAAIQ
jgi:hypothetical protein